MYVRESIAAHQIPVFTYYQLLQSSPADRLLRAAEGPLQPAQPGDDARLLGRLRAAAPARGRLRGHAPGGRSTSSPTCGATWSRPTRWPWRARFAHKLIALRNRLAPHVTLAWHLSTWGTDEDPTYSKPSLAHMRALGAKSAAFYASLHAHFNLVFNDVTDRDAGFYQ